jgi:uncharacterized DUF497 family protein
MRALGRCVLLVPSPFGYREYRNIIIGQVGGVLLTVVYSTPEEDLYRIISARQATANERRTHEQNFIQP